MLPSHIRPIIQYDLTNCELAWRDNSVSLPSIDSRHEEFGLAIIVSAFPPLMRSIHRYVAIDDTEGNRGASTGFHKETRRSFDRSGAAKTVVPFYYRARLSERVSWKFVDVPQDTEIQVNIFAQFEWITVDDVDPEKLLS